MYIDSTNFANILIIEIAGHYKNHCVKINIVTTNITKVEAP